MGAVLALQSGCGLPTIAESVQLLLMMILFIASQIPPRKRVNALVCEDDDNDFIWKKLRKFGSFDGITFTELDSF